MVEPLFEPAHIQATQPYIQKTVTDLLNQMKAKGANAGPVDLVEKFALPVPSYVRHETNKYFPQLYN